jgi:hypothetical protein
MPRAKSGQKPQIEIAVLSTRPNIVTGESALIEVRYLGDSVLPLQVMLNGRKVTERFRPGSQPRTLIGLLDGLHPGRNRLQVQSAGKLRVMRELGLIDYPITGPVLSGPQIQPYRCMTELFRLPDGSSLGPPTDAQCSIPTAVQYVYKTRHGEFRPLLEITTLPADVASVTTPIGVEVPYVVRFEAGTVDRGVYNIAILHDPTAETPPTPFLPPRAWSRKLIWVNGGGCAGGWYHQGTATSTSDGYDFERPLSGGDVIVPKTAGLAEEFNVLNDGWLSRGYAVATSTLNHPSISCNPHLAGEATSMVKEHFIKEFGVPLFTVSTGASGGAYTTEQIADAFPGLFDGILVWGLFPDALSIGLSGLDGHLLTHYFTVTDPGGFSPVQKVAVSGYQDLDTLISAANQAGRTDPVPNRVDVPGYLSAVWHSVGAWPVLDPTPPNERYDPVSNPKGARPTIFDVSIAIYGADPRTGFALRPFDNVGVQYGLAALNAGAISTTQFLDLNAKIGGYDQDANYVAGRTSADSGAIKRAYQSGLSLSGGGGLASIPVFDVGDYGEARGDYHLQWFHFALRERLIRANGDAKNYVMWRGSDVPHDTAESLFDQWVSAYKADSSPLSQRHKVIRHKPAPAVDGCWATAKQFIAEPQSFSAQPNSQCNRLFPSYAAPRLVAGEPLLGDFLKCQLKPLASSDYKVNFTAVEWARLKEIFPGGVCDWSKPGVGQVRVVTWPSFGPSPNNLVYDLRRQL